MTKDGNDILRTLSREQVSRLQNLGATVTETTVTATEDQLWRSGLGSGLRSRLLRGDQLTIADTGGGGGGDWILASGSWDDAGAWDDAAMWKDAA